MVASSKAAVPPTASFEPGYVSALTAANRFLHAWQTGDPETGVVMLTDRAKQHTTEENLKQFFSGGAPQAYEIGRGQRLRAGRYSFPVVLVTVSSGQRHVHRRFSDIVVLRVTKDDWLIDKLP